MGISYSTARWLAPLSFAFDFAAQNYGMMSSPNMKDVHDNNMSFFSPQPFFIAGFFFPQQLFQLAWLYRLWKLAPQKSLAEKQEMDTLVDFVPYYAIGNACIGIWMFFWNSSNLKTANIFVIINTLTQLFYITSKIAPMNTKSTSSILTHVVAKTFAGIGVLDILHNTSVAYAKNAAPGTAVKVLTALGFAAASASSDWIFGGCLVYDLIALAIGQASYQYAGANWSWMLGAYAVGAAAIVAAKNLAKPPYTSKPIDYQAAPGEDVV